MSNITVAVLAPNGYADNLGKKGTTSDITFYNLKKGQSTVTFIEPTRYPEKLSSLFYAVTLADRILLVVSEVNATFGEMVLMLQCAGKANGSLVLKNYLSPDQIAPLIKGTVLEHYDVVEDEPIGIGRNCSTRQESSRPTRRQKRAPPSGPCPSTTTST